jgi:hypothetical protein
LFFFGTIHLRDGIILDKDKKYNCKQRKPYSNTGIHGLKYQNYYYNIKY